MKPLVLYRDDSVDGFCSAFMCWTRYKGDGAEYIAISPMSNDVTIPELLELTGTIVGRTVYVLSIHLPKHLLDYIFTCAESAVWIDHHKESFDVWYGKFKEKMKRSKQLRGGCVEILLNNNRASSMVMWEYLHPRGPKTPPTLLSLVEDYELKRLRMNGSMEANAALLSMRPWTFFKWWRITIPDLLDVGSKLMTYHKSQIEAAVDAARAIHIPVDTTIAGLYDDLVKGLAVNVIDNEYEIGVRLAAESGTFGCCWHVDGSGLVHVSLYSAKTGVDVGAIARRHNGNGVTSYAGFKTRLMTIARWLK